VDNNEKLIFLVFVISYKDNIPPPFPSREENPGRPPAKLPLPPPPTGRTIPTLLPWPSTREDFETPPGPNQGASLLPLSPLFFELPYWGYLTSYLA
jgi:hypothetical protein